MTKDGLRTTPKALFLTHWVHYKLWLFLLLFIHASMVPLILMLNFECECPYFSIDGIFFLFEERKVIAFQISTNAASFFFLQNKGHIGNFSIGIFKIVHDRPFKNCYTACTKMKPTLLSVVRTVASRSICISKLKPKRSNFQGQETILLFNVILKVKISEAQQPLLSCFKFYVSVYFCIFDWHI